MKSGIPAIPALRRGWRPACSTVSFIHAKNRLSELLRAVESGESALITRNGKPVALVAPPPTRRTAQFGTMRGRIHFKPGWDDPIDIDRFLSGEF